MELIKNKVAQYMLISDGAYVQEEMLETIVPDVNPDVLRIVWASSDVCVKEKLLQTGKLRASGEVRSRIFYTAEGDATVWQVEGVTPFACAFDVEEAMADDTLFAICDTVSAQATLVNPRKLSVKTRFSMQTKIYRAQEIEFIEGVECDDADGVNTLVEQTSPLVLVGIHERKIAMNEELRLSGPDVSAADRLYRTEVSFVTEDQRVLTNKIMLRGTATVKALTISEKGGYLGQHVYNLPFSQIVECDNTDPGDDVAVTYALMQKDIRMTTGADGAPMLECSLAATAQALVNRRVNVNVMTDLYSTAYDSTYEACEVSARLTDKVNTVTAAFCEVAEPDYPAVKICDYSIAFEYRKPGQGDRNVLGWVCFQVIYETTTGGLCCMAKRIEVEGQIDCAYSRGTIVHLACQDVDVVCTDESTICMKGKAVFTVTCPECQTYKQVKGCKLNRQSCKSRPKCGTLILRSYDKQESIWQIAKSYGTTTTDIMTANKIADESELSDGRLILIPFGRQ